MSNIWFADPPDPPEGREWCLVCLMRAKDYITELHPDLVKIAEDGKAADHWVPWENAVKLMPAVCHGLCNVPQLGLVPVCWSHLATASLRQGSGLVNGGGVPPGLIRGRG